MPDRFKAIQQQLHQLKERQARDRAQIEGLEKEVKLARGTRNEVKSVSAPKNAPNTQQIIDGLIRLMKVKAMPLQELATELGVEPQIVSNTITALKKQGHVIVNVGEARKAKWYYVPKYRK